MFKSIFSRLTYTLLLITSFVFTVLFGVMSAFYIYYTSDLQYTSATKAAGSIEHLTILFSSEMNDPRILNVYNSTLASLSNIVGSDITVVNSSGDVFASTNHIKSVPENFNETVLSGESIKRFSRFGSYYNGTVFVVGLPIKYNNTTIGGIYFNTPLARFSTSVINFTQMFFFSGLITLLLAILMIFKLAKKISHPITKINQAVLDIASGRFDKRLEVTSKDEISQLASSFNYMADSLENLEKMRESFISDVSHELRTPMTSISGFVEGIIDGTIPPEKHNEYLKIVLSESKRLTKMCSDMLEMSKMSSSEYRLDMKKFDLCEVIRLAIISLENKIDSKSLELDVNFAHEQINVLADKDSIQRVIINLLDNAIKFSFENTKITISAWCDVRSAFVQIGNLGIGIEQKELTHIFDRFYKTDKTRGKDKTGAGLGLSMSKNIIRLHNQKIWAESNNAKPGSDIKYTTFTFTLEMA